MDTLILGLAFMLRVVTLEAQGLWRDEVDQWRFAFLPLRELLGNFSRPGWNGPLYSPLLRSWILIAGESVFAMRFLSVLWGVLGVAFAMILVRRLGGRRLACATGLLLALSPYMIWYAQEIKMYTWVPMLALLALYALDRACQQSRWQWWVVVFTATTLGVYSHILAALLIPVLVGWFLLHPRRHRRAWLGAIMVLGALTLPYLPLLVWQWSLLWQSRETGYPDFGLHEMASALLNGWSAGISQGSWARRPALEGIVVVTVSLAALGLVWFVLRRRWRRGGQVAAWAALPLLGIWLASQRGSIFTDRYLIWSLPAFYVLVAGGVIVVGRMWRPVSLLALAGLATVGMHGWLAQAQEPIKPQFAAAAEIVESQREPGDLLLFQIPYNQRVFAFYASDGLDPWAEAPYTNWREPTGAYRVDDAVVARQMRRLVAGYDRIWLVYSEVQLWDERELVKSWLTANYDLADVVDYHGVSVLLFARRRR